ncbi:MAG: hypothetical protein IKW92_01395 [Firmicutes bacterium]|nr:hypothetical protein [Bacillota bacterium]
MTEKELYELLEIDRPEDVEYFEQLADLMEADEEISEDLFRHALSAIRAENAGEFAENYLAELMNAIPEELSAEDLTEALDAMEQRLLLLAEDLDEAQNREDFIAELYKLRNWLHEEAGASLDGDPCTLLEAFTEMRAEKLGAVSHEYGLDSFPELMPEEISYNLGRFEKIEL